jgi:hypothetical protein
MTRRSADTVVVGEQFGHLTIIGPPVSGDIGKYVPCQCTCRKPVFVLWGRLNSGSTTSCGCMEGNRKHSGRRTRLYSIWQNMKQRCYNANVPAFPLYGGRGISVCEEWRTDFQVFKAWADGRGYADNLTLERVDVNGNYEPSNCKWIPLPDQSANRRSSITKSYDGETKILSEWAKDPRCVVGYHTLYARIRNGWDMHRAMTLPAQGGR